MKAYEIKASTSLQISKQANAPKILKSSSDPRHSTPEFLDKIFTTIIFNTQQSQINLQLKGNADAQKIAVEKQQELDKLKTKIRLSPTSKKLHLAWQEVSSRMGWIRAAVMQNIVHPATQHLSYKALLNISETDTKKTEKSDTKKKMETVQKEILAGGDPKAKNQGYTPPNTYTGLSAFRCLHHTT